MQFKIKIGLKIEITLAYCKEAAEALKGSAWWLTPGYKATAGMIWRGHRPSARPFLQTAEMKYMRNIITILLMPTRNKTPTMRRRIFNALSPAAEHKGGRKDGKKKTEQHENYSTMCVNSLILLLFPVVKRLNPPLAKRNIVQQLRMVSLSLKK